MAHNSCPSDKIEVRISGFFTTHHFFETESEILGELVFPAFKYRTWFRAADGRKLLIKKPGWLKSRHELIEGDMVRGTANQRGLLSSDMVIQFDGQEYTLKQEGLLKQGWFLVDADGNRLVEIRPRGLLKQGAYLSLTGSVDADLVVFVYYLVYTYQQGAAAAASAAV